MKKRFFKRWKRKLRYNGRRYLITLVCVIVAGAGIWFGIQDDDSKSDEVVDFGNAHTSDTAKSISKASYEDALALIAEGKTSEARQVMKRLAPLSDVAEQPLGNGAAHLWVAEYLLGSYDTEFLEVFPLDYGLTNPSKAPALFRDQTVLAEIFNHLQHTVALTPELRDAYLLLASLEMTQGQREEAIKSLKKGLSYAERGQGAQSSAVHDSLLIALANAATYEGDNLALKEQTWHAFSTLGRDVSGSNRAGLAKRVEYAANALLLKNEEVVEIVIARIERDFKHTPREEEAKRVANSLRMATHYFRAVHLLDAARESGDYKSVAEELATAHRLQPGNVLLVNALQLISRRYPALKPEIKKWLEQSEQTGALKSGDVERLAEDKPEAELGVSLARSYLLLSELSETPEEIGLYLKQALKYSPNDPDILLAYVMVQLQLDTPKFVELAELLDRAETNRPEGFQDSSALYFAQGQVFLGLNQKKAAIAAFEKSLAGAKQPEQVHRLLAEAYQSSGHPAIAEAHAEMVNKAESGK